ncbi:MAG: hypothetical protein HUJ76_08435 [Parasporobacterium sp.]|nr:hypothetical protein [Parasporobacterium sp.]
MNAREINEQLEALHQLSWELERAYIENDGEVTENTEAVEVQMEIIRNLLEGEGVDSLGRYLKAEEDSIKAMKAEKDYVTRKIKAKEDRIEYLKELMNNVLQALGKESVKGSLGYSFKATMKDTTTIDKDILKALYADKVQQLLIAGRIPAYVTVTLNASSTKAAEYGLADETDAEIFVRSTRPSIRFTKPRAGKEE